MKYLGSFLLALTLIACETSTQVKGTVEDISDGTNVYLSQFGKNNSPVAVDTTEVSSNTFNFELKGDNTQDINIIQIDGVNGNLIFIDEGTNVNIDVNTENPRESVIEAGPHNTYLKDYIAILTELNEEGNFLQGEYMKARQNQDQEKMMDIRTELEDLQEKSKDKALEFIKSHKNSIVGLMALSDALNSKSIPLNKLKPIYEDFEDSIKDTPLGKSLGENIAKVGATDIGAEAPKFSGPTPEGDELALEDAMGKVTLIDFWASWCKPCRLENPNIVSVYNDYKDQGFSVIGVSLDKPNRKDAWLKAIEEDQLEWNHVSHLEFWQEPIAQKYNVKAIPAAFLIDENGVIIGKDLRGQALRDKVKEVLED